MAGKIHTDEYALGITEWCLAVGPGYPGLTVVAVDRVNGTITLERSSTVEHPPLKRVLVVRIHPLERNEKLDFSSDLYLDVRALVARLFPRMERDPR